MTFEKNDMHDVNWQKVWPDRMPVILRDLAPTNPFNPRNLWPEEQAAASNETQEEIITSKTETKAKSGSKTPKLKKADLIRLQLAKDKYDKQCKIDEEKLSNVKKSNNLLSMKMATPGGRLKQLYEIMRECCKKKEMIDAVDTLWEIQRLPEDEENEEEIRSIHKKYRKYAKQINEFLQSKETKLIEFQLTEMSDRLPPLNMHHMNKFILDTWQRTVLTHIDNKQSVIVCAPTSSGKTVLSSYVSVVGGKVLFLVPTDPLAWQVAALFQAMVKGTVALITEGTVFVPNGYKVAVGTPRAVESTLLEIGYDFDYAVYDEVHDLNGAEGDALERIIKSLTCPFLALSATIGNAQKLHTWWSKHHTQSKIHLLEYKGRFINLQRLVWTKNELVSLHPCASVTLSYLQKEGFENGDLAFTPRDTFALWEAMEKFYPADQIQDISPHKVFAFTDEDQVDSPTKKKDAKKSSKKSKSKSKDSKDSKKSKSKGGDDDDKDYEVDLGVKCHRITLMESKLYEEKVKQRLQSLSHDLPKETQVLLDHFAAPESLRLEETKTTNEQVDVYGLVQKLTERQLVPAIAFQLDAVRCRQLFDQLLNALEEAEVDKYPLFREKLQEEYDQWEKQQAVNKKREGRNKQKDQEEQQREAQEFEDTSTNPPDLYAPHPEFILTPQTSRLTATEFKEIRWQLRRELSSSGTAEGTEKDGHPLVRSLRRGIGIYNENLPAGYLRIVQSLAQAGRLAVVFSDDSLAYGVNMPFRTCLFCEDTSEEVLTSLMVQQMAGRAGRRGLDRQGNIVFAGISWKRIQFLMRGLLPDVVGRKSLYPTIALQRLLSPLIDGEIMNRIVSHPLDEFMASSSNAKKTPPSSPTKKTPSYLAQSVKWMSNLGLLTPDYKLMVDRSVAKLVWECRDDCAEALGIFNILDILLKEFHHKPGDQIHLQLALFNMVLRVVGREKYHPEYAHAAQLSCLDGQEEAWEKISQALLKYNQKLDELQAPTELRLALDLDDPLDGYVWRTVVDNLIPSGLGTAQLNLIKKRLRHVGDRLRLMHNLLMHSGRYGELEEIVRKCFRRIKWILIDSEV